MLKQPNKSCFFQTTSIVKIVLSTLSIKPPFFKVPSIKSIISLDKKSSSWSSWPPAMSTTSSGTSTVHFDGSNQMTIDRRQEIAAEAQDITLRSHSLFQQRNSDNVKFNHVKIQLRVDVENLKREAVIMDFSQKVPDNIDQWTFANSNESGGKQSRLLTPQSLF